MRRGERGAAAVEWALLAPLLMLLVAVMVAGWRLTDARAGVQQAAQAGARAASLQSGPAQAQTAGRAQASRSLQGTTCLDPQIDVVTPGPVFPVGRPAAAQVTVICRVPLADLLVPGLPGSITVRAAASTPIDRYGRR